MFSGAGSRKPEFSPTEFLWAGPGPKLDPGPGPGPKICPGPDPGPGQILGPGPGPGPNLGPGPAQRNSVGLNSGFRVDRIIEFYDFVQTLTKTTRGQNPRILPFC